MQHELVTPFTSDLNHMFTSACTSRSYSRAWSQSLFISQTLSLVVGGGGGGMTNIAWKKSQVKLDLSTLSTIT